MGSAAPGRTDRPGHRFVFTSNPDVVEAVDKKRLQARIVAQGSLAEAIRAGGAGLGGFFTPTGVGTLLAEGREQRQIGDQTYLFEPALRADVALVRAAAADELGNLVYNKSARNFNPEMATAAAHVIAEVDRIVPIGELSPDTIVTPHIYIDAIVLREPA